MVQQNESFNYLRYPDNYIMDSWSGMDSGDLSKTKPRLSSDEELATLSLFYETCKVTQRYIFKKIKIIISYNYLICIIYRNNIINVLFLRPLKGRRWHHVRVRAACTWKVSLTMHFYDLWIKMLL